MCGLFCITKLGDVYTSMINIGSMWRIIGTSTTAEKAKKLIEDFKSG